MSLDFIGIGFPKCGTTYLYKKMLEHPCVSNNKKERHFFSKPFHTFTEEEYKNYLSNFRRGDVNGEFSPGVLYYPLNIKYLSKVTNEDTKFITVIRNPIDRAHSHYKQLNNARMGIVNPDNKEEFRRLSLYPEAIYTGLYSFAFDQLFKYISKEQIIIIQYEKLLENLHEEMNNLWEFMGLDKAVIRDDTRKPSQYNSFRDELREFYEQDVEKLFNKYSQINKYSHIDCSYWKDFNGL